jgi:hypothetical protein
MQMKKIRILNNENKKKPFHWGKHKDLSESLFKDFNAFRTFPGKKTPAISASFYDHDISKKQTFLQAEWPTLSCDVNEVILQVSHKILTK